MNPEFLQLLPEVDVFRAMPKFESCAVVRALPLSVSFAGRAATFAHKIIRYSVSPYRVAVSIVHSPSVVLHMNCTESGCFLPFLPNPPSDSALRSARLG